MNRMPKMLLASLALLIAAAATASADPLLPVAGNVTGQFLNFTPPGCVNPVDPTACSPYKTFEGIDLLSGRVKQVVAFDWGIRGTDDSVLAQSELVLEKLPFSATTGQAFTLTNLEYRNLINSAPAQMSVDLEVILQFTIPDIPDTIQLPFTLRITNTPDQFWPPSFPADTLFLPTTFTPASFSAGGVDYTVNLLGFYKDGGLIDHITASEHIQPLFSGTSADLMARVDAVTAAVPEPGSVFLLAGCAVAALAFGRKRIQHRG